MVKHTNVRDHYRIVNNKRIPVVRHKRKLLNQKGSKLGQPRKIRPLDSEIVKRYKQSQNQSREVSTTFDEAIFRDLGANFTPEDITIIKGLLIENEVKNEKDVELAKKILMNKVPELASRILPIKLEHTIRYFLNKNLSTK